MAIGDFSQNRNRLIKISVIDKKISKIIFYKMVRWRQLKRL